MKRRFVLLIGLIAFMWMGCGSSDNTDQETNQPEAELVEAEAQEMTMDTIIPADTIVSDSL